MGTLISPGTQVSVTDNSFYIPAQATTVPLFFIATRANKYVGQTLADGTAESGVIRTVTSMAESIATYGVPVFNELGGSVYTPYHGDSLNEYGLLGVNQYLNDGDLAYVVRANIDLSNRSSTFYGFEGQGTSKLQVVDVEVEGVGDAEVVSAIVGSSTSTPQTYQITFTSASSYIVEGSVSGTLGTGVFAQNGVDILSTFSSTRIGSNLTLVLRQITEFAPGDYITFATEYKPYSVTVPVGTGVLKQSNLGLVRGLTLSETYSGESAYTIQFLSDDPVTNLTTFELKCDGIRVGSVGTVGVPFVASHSGGQISFTVDQCADLPVGDAGYVRYGAGFSYELRTKQFQHTMPLGFTDAERRQLVVSALRKEIVSNENVRMEQYQYNLIVCPGYHEVGSELVMLADSNDGGKREAFVIADTPCNLNPVRTVNWADTSPDRTKSNSIAYYYPWGISTNLDGKRVLAAPSGIALSVYTRSDKAKYVWQAPMGLTYGTVNNATEVGYVSGTLGGPTTFNRLALNRGHTDNLYKVGTAINPLTDNYGEGVVVWGQKTSAIVSSARDRVNVERLIREMVRDLRKFTRVYVGRGNTSQNRKDLKADLVRYCADKQANDALYDFAVYCDSTNNTGTTIDRNEVHAKIAIKPVKTIEFVYIDLSIQNTDDTL